MRKLFYISLLLTCFLNEATAQKIIYQDSTLLQQEEEYVEEETVEVVPAETQDETVTDVEVYADTSLYPNGLAMPYDSVKNWQNLKAYAYNKYLDSLLKNRTKEEEPTYTPAPRGGGFLNSFLGSGFLAALLWIAAIAFVLFIIYRLFLADGVFQRRSKAIKNDVAGVEEEVITKESDFDGLIRNALQSGNYRQAVRYQYLRTLHVLADKHFVELSPDKTNFQYVREIANYKHQQEFAALTMHYEYVWYGEFNIEKNIYDRIENNFTSFNQKI